MCISNQEPRSESIDLPVRRPVGGPPTVDELPSESRNSALPNSVKEAKDRIKNRYEEKKLSKGYKTPLTLRSISNFVDRQNVDEASNPKQHIRQGKMAKWVDGVQQEGNNGQSSA